MSTPNIKIFKFLNNEEIMAEIESEDETHFVIINPVGIAIVRGQDGRPNVGFAPWPLHANQSTSSPPMSVAKKHIMYYYDPAEDFLNNYNQIFGSGIVVPPTKQIITG